MKVQFKVEVSDNIRVVTCPAMPGFKYAGPLSASTHDAYSAFAAWFEKQFQVTLYIADGVSASYVDVAFGVIGD